MHPRAPLWLVSCFAPSQIGADPPRSTWEDLLRFEKERSKRQATTGLSGALLIGTQDENAERLPFINRVDHALLLHFWTLTVRIFVPEMIDSDGQREFVGLVLA